MTLPIRMSMPGRFAPLVSDFGNERRCMLMHASEELDPAASLTSAILRNGNYGQAGLANRSELREFPSLSGAET